VWVTHKNNSKLSAPEETNIKAGLPTQLHPTMTPSRKKQWYLSFRQPHGYWDSQGFEPCSLLSVSTYMHYLIVNTLYNKDFNFASEIFIIFCKNIFIDISNVRRYN
jgi:hypothetical protein